MDEAQAEILRLRTRVHEQEGTLGGIVHRLAAVEATIGRIEPLVDDLVADDRVQEAVQAAIREKHTLRLTTVQRVVAILVTLVTLVTPYALLLLSR